MRRQLRYACAVAVLAVAVAGDVTASSVAAEGATMGSVLCSGFAACSSASFTTNGYPQHEGESYWTMYAGNNCTNYVAYVESAVFGVPTPTYNLGDGGAWASAAAHHGQRVDGVPSVGAVAVWVGGSSGIPWPGHVAVVETVGPRGRYIDISQQHISGDADGFDWTRIYRDAADNQWQQWPTRFVHFHGGPGALVDGVHLGVTAAPPKAVATMSVVRATGGRHPQVWRIRMSRASSPSLTAVPHGYEIAFPTTRRVLATAGSEGARRYRVIVRSGTDPTITAVLHGYEVALQARTGHLVTVGAAGARTWSFRLRADTSPSITPLFGGGYEVAFQSQTGGLVTMGTGGVRRWHLGMRAATSPSITALFGGGYEVALQANTGHLLTVGTASSRRWALRLRPRTSPSITAAFGGGYEVAAQSDKGQLWALGSLGSRHWRINMRAGTSPSIAAQHGGGFEVALQSVRGRLVTVGSRADRVWPVQMELGTSPSIRP